MDGLVRDLNMYMFESYFPSGSDVKVSGGTCSSLEDTSPANLISLIHHVSMLA